MNLAKSLHTVTVYQRLIAHFMLQGYPETIAVQCAKEILGHEQMTDTYGLVDKALRLLQPKEVKQ